MNRLIKETSPYLKQHASNPIDWYPWGDQALEIAKKENKLVFISIGYAACHWCHIMEKESFCSEEVANILNKHFISIKIDREERPDIDHSFMSAVQLMTGSGGWPLNCISTPEGKPFYGGSYFPKKQFLIILHELKEIWINEPEKIKNHALKIYQGVVNTELITIKLKNQELLQASFIFQKISKDFDKDYGGLRQIPKFLIPVLHQFLLSYYYHYNEEKAISQVRLTLTNILSNGIYDQLEGGISRYSTDKFWQVPHFEKMLYDTSQFISLLSEFYTITKEKDILKKIKECIFFSENVLSENKNLFYSSVDADSNGIEGEYYIWREEEINQITGVHSGIIKEYFGIKKTGNWEDGKNILAINSPLDFLAEKHNIPKQELEKIIKELKNKLLTHRNTRIPPTIDTKQITSWNAMHIIAYADSWQACGAPAYKHQALNIGEQIVKNLLIENISIIRVANSNIPGFLDDYAFSMKAFIKLYQISFDEKWLNILKQILDYTIDQFYNEKSGMFYYSGEEVYNPLTRQTEITDSVIPSSNSIMAEVLLYCSIFYENEKYKEIALQMLTNIQSYLSRNPSFFSHWAYLLILFEKRITEIVISGPDYHKFRKEFTGNYLPQVIFAGAKSDNSKLSLLKNRFIDNETNIYICINQQCDLPVKTVSEALTLIKEKN